MVRRLVDGQKIGWLSENWLMVGRLIVKIFPIFQIRLLYKTPLRRLVNVLVISSRIQRKRCE